MNLFDDVSIVSCTDYSEETIQNALTRVLEPLGGLSFLYPGIRVVIKANLVSFIKPELAATTHPALLCVLVKMLRQYGAQVVIGDSPGGIYNKSYVEHVYEVTGMYDTEAVGANLNHNFGETETLFPGATVLKSFTYTSYLDDADVIIDFCKLKSHGMMGMSAAAKNMFGVIPGLTKPQYHFRFPDPADFSRMIVDINEYFRPKVKLCITDAVIAMEGNGPTQGTPRWIGALLASASPHCSDLLAAHLIGLEPDSVPTLQAAIERGLIPEHWSKLNIIGDPEKFVLSDFQNVAVKNSLLFSGNGKNPVKLVFSKLAGKLLRSVPAVDCKICIGCTKCAKQCPAEAIQMKNGKPVIHRKSCIRCFCCQEFCPVGAMKVKKPFVTRLLNPKKTK